MLIETVNYFVKCGSNEYGCFLDASKAFDKVHFGKLFSLLMSKCLRPPHTRAHGCAIVGQIMGPIVQIVIQASNLARMFFGDYWSNLPEVPLENPRWRPFFQDGRHFQYNFFFK